MKLLAIDPGSNKCGLAYFVDGTLTTTKTLTTEGKTPLTRRLDIATKISKAVVSYTTVSEEPLLLGRNNSGMQRLLGCFEFVTGGAVTFIHPLTIKKAIAGSGKAEKLEVALAAGGILKTDAEKEILADAIRREAWDESDAIAVGLTFLGKQ